MPKMVNTFQQRHLDWFCQVIPAALVELDLTQPELETLGKIFEARFKPTNTKFSTVKWQLGWKKGCAAALEGEALPELPVEEDMGDEPDLSAQIPASPGVMTVQEILAGLKSGAIAPPPPEPTDELFDEGMEVHAALI